jgi:Domain of unknown function (DUF397)
MTAVERRDATCGRQVAAAIGHVGWRKSSYTGSQGNCVEAAPLGPVMWRTSSHSGSQGNCIEAAALEEATWSRSGRSGTSGTCIEVAGRLRAAVAVRDSKDPSGAELAFPAQAWRLFTAALKVKVPAQS